MIGALVGALTGIPIGPANVAVINTAYRHTLRRAISVGAGAAIADGGYALLGILLIAQLLADNPSLAPILWAVSGGVLIVYGLITALADAEPAKASSGVKQKASDPSRDIWSGLFLGVTIIVLNPAALVTWVVIVGERLPVWVGSVGTISLSDSIGFALGVTAGSFTWFSFVGYLANKGKKVLGERAFLITKTVGVLLVVYGAYLAYRAVNAWMA